MNRFYLAGLLILILLVGAALWLWPEDLRDEASVSADAGTTGDLLKAEGLEQAAALEVLSAGPPKRVELAESAPSTSPDSPHPRWEFADGRPLEPETWFYVVDGVPRLPGDAPPNDGERIEVAGVDPEGFTWIEPVGVGPYTEPFVIREYVDVRVALERYPGGEGQPLEVWCLPWAARNSIEQLSWIGARRIDQRIEDIAGKIASDFPAATAAWADFVRTRGSNPKPVVVFTNDQRDSVRIPRLAEDLIFFMKDGVVGWNFVYPSPAWKQPLRLASEADRADRDRTLKIQSVSGGLVELALLAWGPIEITGRIAEPPLLDSLTPLPNDYQVTVRHLETREKVVVRYEELEAAVQGPNFQLSGLRPGDKALVLAREIAPDHVRAYASRLGPVASGAKWDVGVLDLQPWNVVGNFQLSDPDGFPLEADVLDELRACELPVKLSWSSEDALSLTWTFDLSPTDTLRFEGLGAGRMSLELRPGKLQLTDGRTASLSSKFEGQASHRRPQGEQDWIHTLQYRVTLSDPPR